MKTALPAQSNVVELGTHGTLASRACEALRRDIIRAQFAPGAKLLIRALCERYGVGSSPMREALNRLSRDGLVGRSDQRGFWVMPLDQEHLAELTRTRCWLNEVALRESIRRGREAWEESVVLAYHRLQRTPRYPDGHESQTYNPAWERAHRAFHSSLIAACESRWLIGFCEQLFDSADRYRYLSRVMSRARKVKRDEHRAIVDAVLARDADRAVALLNRHFDGTARLVHESNAIAAKRPAAGRRPITSRTRGRNGLNLSKESV
ncbi:MAG: FCD domain-containing protein [Burkholderiales bacterium]|nr:FCD domain-containing protein [Burkholderiales bacterium]